MEHTKDEIILNGKTVAEMNAEFLVKYDSDDKQIDYYTRLAMELYETFQIDGTFTYEGVRKNVAVWFENKREQMELFRRHPYWVEEAKAIVFTQTETRGIDYAAADTALDHLIDYVRDKLYVDGDHSILLPLRYGLHGVIDKGEEQTPFITQAFIDNFNSHLPRRAELPECLSSMLRVGTKVTRFIRKVFTQIILEGGDVYDATTLVDEGDPRTRKSFDRYYAKFADHMSELSVEKVTVVSLNFLDFMTMSNGNSWSSCHFINSRGIFHDSSDGSYHGLYKAGCLSYALDKPSCLLYTLPASYNGVEYYSQQKMTRMCCQYENGMLITGKCYPDNNDALITRYRQIMQLIISQVTGFPNMWTFSKKMKKINCFAETARNSAHYPDYNHDNQRPTISICKSMSDIDATITIGHEAFCLHCGELLYGDNHDSMQCGRHNKPRFCGCCGRYFKMSDNYKTIDGTMYCDECTFYCEYHLRYEPISSRYGTVTMHDGDKVVCHDAMGEMSVCAECGVYFRDEERTGICRKCIRKYVKCWACGKYVQKSSAHKARKHSYCEDCHTMRLDEFRIRRKRYRVGDYVLIKKSIDGIRMADENEMRGYLNKIVRITYIDEVNDCKVTDLDGHDWWWDTDCFVGVVEGADDRFVGKTPEEIEEMIKEINDEN